MTEIFQDELLKDEKILWSGKPETSVLFTPADIFLIPFSILWGGFAIFWELAVLFSKDESGKSAPLFFALFGIPFVLLGVHFIFGRFIWKNFKKKRTNYAVTNKRVLVSTHTFNKSFQAEFIDRIPSMSKRIRRDGVGSIYFGNANFMASIYGNTGMDFFGSFYGPYTTTFYDIRDAEQVYQLVSGLRKQ
jgi:hypothetical protein